ncbi:crocetin glucosyltransferase, chloroplastic-like [Dorcoceras hygrometricum]|nr:crocetin glucosyltransferase, chloroplastic-like [Dorcoceras hygrometricum]
METLSNNRRNFLIICFPLQGHINPALQLAKNLAHEGANVTFSTTGSGLRRAHQTLPSIKGLSYISFYDGLDHESADGFSAFMADLRKAGSENLQELLEKFVEMGQKVDCLVYSFLLPWAGRVARAMNVPSAFLSIQCATAFSIYHRFFNGQDELEEDAIRTFKDTMNVVPIGPLIPSAFTSGNDSKDKSYGGNMLDKNNDYIQWLDKKMKVLWTDRDIDYIKESLENEVENEDGLIVPWCSQMEVLTHKSVGCFVTHCGWNSTLESLVSGVPVICCPHFSDQTTNAKMVEEVWATGVRARVNGQVVTGRDEFKRCLEMVMGDGDIRCRCKKWKSLAMEAVQEGGSTNRNLKLVVDGNYKLVTCVGSINYMDLYVRGYMLWAVNKVKPELK